MAYIYKIINDVNNKIYIGKTNFSIERRWQEHCNEYPKSRVDARPLYRAIRKYGIEHFHIEQVEECSIEEVNDREKYWIEYYGSFKYGYNATIGGDGKPYCDYELVYALYNEGLSIAAIASKLNYDVGHCSKILTTFGISKDDKRLHASQLSYKPVLQIDKDTDEIVAIFPSIQAAEEATGNGKHIASVCKGKRKTAAGYKWRYADIK